MNYTHDELGALYLEDTDWNADDVRVPFAEDLIGVSLANGSETEPALAALYGYQWIQSNWRAVLSLIQEQAFEFYSPYVDAFNGVPIFATPADLLGSETLRYLRVFDKDNFEITFRFAWQERGDSHEITFYVENGKCEAHTVDG
ncbi:MAG: hypothetical protein K0U72_06630 [Gammaproteobacteria bacterium]|nr:hypothetical protein [Gammaproteobacteria bacterium]